MKIFLKVAILFVAVSLLTSCRVQKPLTNNYEVQALRQGLQGTVLMKVFSYGTTVEEATERAKMDAVHAVIFKGIPGSNVARPLVSDPTLEQSKNEYWLNFFGVDNWLDRSNTRQNRKLRYGRETAPYRSFVSISNDGSVSGQDRFKVDGGYKVGVVVSVQHTQLRKKLEQDNIIRGFGL